MSSIHVFLVDDDKMFNFIHTQIVKSARLDLAVTAYQDANLALKELRDRLTVNDARAIIFVDINMPELDGWGFLEKLSLFPAPMLDNCEVFMLSSSNDTTDIEKAGTYSLVKGYLSKPLTAQQMHSIYRKEYATLMAAFDR